MRAVGVAVGLPVAVLPGKRPRGGGRGPNLVPADLSANQAAAASAGVTVGVSSITFTAAASLARGQINTLAPLVNGGWYYMKYRITGRSAGSVAGIGYATGQNGNIGTAAADGTYEGVFQMTAGGSFNQRLNFQAQAANTTLVVDQIELRRIT